MQLQETIQQKSVPVPESGCWLWLGYVNPNGYGQQTVNGKHYKAHRVSYEAFKGPIPTGLQLDHLCRVRCCVNPDHLEAVTQRTNLLRGVGVTAIHARKTHCTKGHPYSHENTRYEAKNKRHCRTCGSLARTAQTQRERALKFDKPKTKEATKPNA